MDNETINKIFKAYDIRGKYPEELNETIAFKIGQAVADYFSPTRILIGCDHRKSSFPLLNAVANGAMKQGIDVVNMGLSTTPMFYFAAMKENFEAGLMITASHNTYEYNGLKIVQKNAVPIGMGIGMENIRDLVLGGNFRSTIRQGVMTSKDLTEHYIYYLKSFQTFPLDKNLKIVIDACGGPASSIAEKILKEQVNIISVAPQPIYKILGPNPLKPEVRQKAKDTLLDQKADGALLLDGDGDRFFVLDEKGRFIPGHFIAAVLAEYILKKHPGEKVVCDLRFSRAVLKTIERNGGVPILSRIGHSYIKNKMKQENAIFGAEMSGHYYFRSFNNNFYSDNGIIPALLLLEIISKTSKKLSEIFDPFFEKYFVSEEINFSISNPQNILKEVEEKFKNDVAIGQAEIVKLDGLTVRYSDWWFNIRPSNTEPLMRLVIEADSDEKLKEKIDFITQIMQEFK